MNAHEDLLDRRVVVAELLRGRGELLVVSGLGGTTWDVASCGDDRGNFYLWGGMGAAVPLGLGLALAQPTRRVLVVTGDGEMLMGVGALATVAAQQPRNLAIAVIDNERYGETGGQLTHTTLGCDLALMARGAGIGDTRTLRDLEGVRAWRDLVQEGRGPAFAVFKVGHANAGMVLPPRDGVSVAVRFRSSFGVD
jgi:thiamine pyrophosphate-dependent acetolactate synthase large subunit-like protein